MDVAEICYLGASKATPPPKNDALKKGQKKTTGNINSPPKQLPPDEDDRTVSPVGGSGAVTAGRSRSLRGSAASAIEKAEPTGGRGNNKRCDYVTRNTVYCFKLKYVM